MTLGNLQLTRHLVPRPDARRRRVYLLRWPLAGALLRSTPVRVCFRVPSPEYRIPGPGPRAPSSPPPELEPLDDLLELRHVLVEELGRGVVADHDGALRVG